MKKALALIALVALVCSVAFAQAAAEAQQKGPVTLTWWDQYSNQAGTHQAIFDAFEAETGNKVEMQNYSSSAAKDAFDLAIRSNQSPDIMSNPWKTNGIAAKYYEGALGAMTVKASDLPEYIQKELYEGYTMFDGEVYSFPTKASNHSVLFWYDTDKLSADQVPGTLAELRELFKSLTDPANNQYGIALPMSDTGRMNDNICYLISAAGGNRELNPLTGYYEYDNDISKAVMQWFIDIYQDGSVHPASLTLATRTVRERFIAGEAAFAIDGVWYPGSIKKAFGEDVLYRLGVHGTPVLTAGTQAKVGAHPVSGTFYLSSTCEDPEVATDLLLKLLDDSYAISIANDMDQPPLNTSAIAKADVVPVYVEACEIMEDEIIYMPEALLRNANIAEVYAERVDIKPNLGDILVGYLTGAITDWEAAVSDYNAKMNAELDRAIDAVKKSGVKVDHSDFVFPNFVPGESYTRDMYEAL